MIVLHNSHDRGSRDFVAQAINDYSDIDVIDWFSDDIQSWIASGNTLQVSAFPSVVLELDELVGGDIYIRRKPESVHEAMVEKKVRETELLISQEQYDNAQIWINNLADLGYDITELQAWLNTASQEEE